MSDNEVRDYGPRKTVVNAAVDWPRLRLSEQVKHLRFFRDQDNNIVVFAVMPFDSTQPGGDVLPIGKVGVADPIVNASYARCYGLPCCGWPETTVGLVTHSTQMLQKGTMLEAKRTLVTWRRAVASNIGDTAVWTPAAGNTFRLLGLDVFMGGGATLAAAGNCEVQIRDGAIVLFSWSPYVNNAVVVGLTNYINKTIIFPDNGYWGTLINRPLNINLSTALATGVVSITAWGTEGTF